MTVESQAPDSKFAFVVVVARRARQLMSGAVPLLANPRSHKTYPHRRGGIAARASGISIARSFRARRRREGRQAAQGVARRGRSMRVALGVSGGVAAYKAAELVRRLQQESIDVQVVMTRERAGIHHSSHLCGAHRTKSHHRNVRRRRRRPANVESAIEHIAVAQRIDLLVVAPATADMIAKLAHGIADDFLTTLYLATKAPVVVAPAMNVNMWEHAATQENLATLRARGVHVVAPEEGYLACGMTGAGRLAGIEAIAQTVCEVLGHRHDLAGRNDPRHCRSHVRRSRSGSLSHQSLFRQDGLRAGEAAVRRGARVILISGPTRLDPPR